MARDAQAEQFCDLGWEIACAVTPETAYATHVKLAQLRWTAGVRAPKRFARGKAVDVGGVAGGRAVVAAAGGALAAAELSGGRRR